MRASYSRYNIKREYVICCVVTSNFLCAVPREVQSNCLVMNVDVGVGQQNQKMGTMLVYPNPAHDALIIEKASFHSTIQLSDITGRVVLQGTVNSERYIFNISQLAKGTYLLYITDTENNRISRKVVKE